MANIRYLLEQYSYDDMPVTLTTYLLASFILPLSNVYPLC